MTRVFIKGFNENADVETIKDFNIETTFVTLYAEGGTMLAYATRNIDRIEILSNTNTTMDIVTITLYKNDFDIAIFQCDKISFVNNSIDYILCKNGDLF